MAERLRSVAVEVEVDTTKRTVTKSFTLADYEDRTALGEAVTGFLDDMLDGMG